VEDLDSYPVTIAMPPQDEVADGRFWCKAAGPLLGLALLAHHEQFGRPDSERVRAILGEAYPDA
jgi:hypothetical protein